MDRTRSWSDGSGRPRPPSILECYRNPRKDSSRIRIFIAALRPLAAVRRLTEGGFFKLVATPRRKNSAKIRFSMSVLGLLVAIHRIRRANTDSTTKTRRHEMERRKSGRDCLAPISFRVFVSLWLNRNSAIPRFLCPLWPPRARFIVYGRKVVGRRS